MKRLKNTFLALTACILVGSNQTQTMAFAHKQEWLFEMAYNHRYMIGAAAAAVICLGVRWAWRGGNAEIIVWRDGLPHNQGHDAPNHQTPGNVLEQVRDGLGKLSPDDYAIVQNCLGTYNMSPHNTNPIMLASSQQQSADNLQAWTQARLRGDIGLNGNLEHFHTFLQKLIAGEFSSVSSLSSKGRETLTTLANMLNPLGNNQRLTPGDPGFQATMSGHPILNIGSVLEPLSNQDTVELQAFFGVEGNLLESLKGRYDNDSRSGLRSFVSDKEAGLRYIAAGIQTHIDKNSKEFARHCKQMQWISYLLAQFRDRIRTFPSESKSA